MSILDLEGRAELDWALPGGRPAAAVPTFSLTLLWYLWSTRRRFALQLSLIVINGGADEGF